MDISCFTSDNASEEGDSKIWIVLFQDWIQAFVMDFNPTYYRPFGATSDIGGAQCTPPISYACSTCAIVMKLSEIKQLDK